MLIVFAALAIVLLALLWQRRRSDAYTGDEESGPDSPALTFRHTRAGHMVDEAFKKPKY